MKFTELQKEFEEKGILIKLPTWLGYWKWENNTIMMYNKDNTVIDIRKTDDVRYTLANILSDKWIVATKENCPLLGGKLELSFEDATKYAERGCFMGRDAWTGGEYMYVEITNKGLSEIRKFMMYDGIRREYKPSYEDVKAHDWGFRK